MAGLATILERWRRGECSDEIALMELLLAAEDVDEVRAAVALAPALARLLQANAAGCARICAMLQSGVDTGGAPAASVEEGIAFARRLFDWSVQQSEEASVALYSLGNAEILSRATDEVVSLLDHWQLLTPSARVLEIGCGIGRLLPPIAAQVASVVGIDVSPRMVEVAARRCAAIPGVTVSCSSGRDLAELGDASLELVLAVDSFPYIVQAGAALAATMFCEVGRVLVPGGRFVVLNYSYRGDEDTDRAEAGALAANSGLTLRVNGSRPFSLWNALAFLFQRAEGTPSSRR